MSSSIKTKSDKPKGKGKGKDKGARAGSAPNALVNNVREMRDGDWSCPACGNVNFANKMVCHNRLCGIARPAGMGGKARPYGKGR